MAKKTYQVKTPIDAGKDQYAVDDVIYLDEQPAAQLVEAGALVEQLQADKKSGKGASQDA